VTRLEEIFHVANSRYFRSKLKNVKIKWAKTGIPRHAVAVTWSVSGSVPKGTRKFLIEISQDLRKYKSITILTVLHEMVHVEQWDKIKPGQDHGRLFQNRMKDLAAKGAFNGLW
jgi:hypothetical protein